MYQQSSRTEMPGFAVGGNIWYLFWRGKCLKIGCGGGRWCQVLEGVFDALGLIEELKSPCGHRGLRGKINKSCGFGSVWAPNTQDNQIVQHTKAR